MDIFLHHIKLGPLRAQVSEEDADLAETRWHLVGGKGDVGQYAATRFRLSGGSTYRTVYLHRIIAQRMGLIPEVVGNQGGRWTKSIDHANGDKLDNRRENLRLRDRRQQMSNTADKLQQNNTSGTRGVSYVQKTGRWYANVMVDGRTISLGHHDTEEEAIGARRAWDERQVKPLARELRSDNTSGCPGVSYAPQRGARPWVATCSINGKRKHLGGFATKEEAMTARRAWDEGRS